MENGQIGNGQIGGRWMRGGGGESWQAEVLGMPGDGPWSSLDKREEERRRRSVRRGRKAERRWIAQALKQWGCQSRKGKGQALLLQAVHMLLWLLSGIGAIGLSGALLLSTGIEQRERTEGPSLLLEGGAAPDWEREFFGVRIQLQNGQITFFREKEEAVPADGPSG